MRISAGDEAARRENLRWVVAHSRFLIVPGVQVPNPASHVLGSAPRRLPADWEACYGVRPVLLETFVDPARFDGSCYRAANGIDVGKTSGRRDGIAKCIWFYPLDRQWREQLCAAAPLRLAAPIRSDPLGRRGICTLRVSDERLKQRLFSFRKLAEVQALCPETQPVSVGDRESDLYELFAEATRGEAVGARRAHPQPLWGK